MQIVKSIFWNEYIKDADCQDTGFLFNFFMNLNTYVLIDDISYIHRAHLEQYSKKETNSLNAITEYKNMLQYLKKI